MGIGRDRQQVAQSRQVEVVLRMCRQGVAVVGFQARHARAADVVPQGVAQQAHFIVGIECMQANAQALTMIWPAPIWARPQ